MSRLSKRGLLKELFIYDLRKLCYTFCTSKENVEKTQYEKSVMRGLQSIVRVFHLFGNPTNLSRPSRKNLSACAIDSRVRNSFSIVCEETLRSYISYENSTWTDERTSSRIHSAILIARFLLLSGMRKLTFLRIMCESWRKSYDVHRDILLRRYIRTREVEFG